MEVGKTIASRCIVELITLPEHQIHFGSRVRLLYRPRMEKWLGIISAVSCFTRPTAWIINTLIKLENSDIRKNLGWRVDAKSITQTFGKVEYYLLSSNTKLGLWMDTS